MQLSLLNKLRCPDCRQGQITVGEISKDEGALDPEEVFEGVLSCSNCDSWFPVIDGVPRMLPTDLRDKLPNDYPDFYRRNADKLPSSGRSAPVVKDVYLKGQEHVMDAFGFEWNEFSEYSNDNFDQWVEPLTPEFFDGKFGLDAGCGAGRHSRKAHSYGARLIAMDLSPAVDASYAKAREIDGIDVVQGDIFSPPLMDGIFEFIYSIGVIHHTPDPPRAFQQLVAHLKPGGTICCLVYASGRPLALGLLDGIRTVTTRLPLPIVRAVSWTVAAFDTAIPITSFRIARKLGVNDETLAKLFPEHVRIYADRSFDTNYTDWQDRLSYPYVHYYSPEEVQGWFDTAGLEQTKVNEVGTHGVTGVGVTPVS
jgi:SAM-dependent methyltransferase/uncharacterized protein YbaR (Trm112 family)